LAEILDISHEHIAVFETDIHNPDSDIVVLVERHAPIEEQDIDALLVAIPKEAFPINRMLLSKSREIPRTTSGKNLLIIVRWTISKLNEARIQTLGFIRDHVIGQLGLV